MVATFHLNSKQNFAVVSLKIVFRNEITSIPKCFEEFNFSQHIRFHKIVYSVHHLEIRTITSLIIASTEP